VPTREDLIRRLVLINEIGWVRGPKPADKEVGDVLEGLLGLTTNSLRDPDWGIHEVKTQRRGRSNPVSLLSKKPNYKGGLSAKEFVRQHGYDKHGQKALWMGLKPHKKDDKGWTLWVTDSRLEMDYQGNVVASQKLDALKKAFKDKLQNLVFVIADSKTESKWEFFRYNEAYLFSGLIEDRIPQLLESKHLVFEFRMGWRKTGQWKDNGEGYRMHRRDLEKLYLCKTRIV